MRDWRAVNVGKAQILTSQAHLCESPACFALGDTPTFFYSDWASVSPPLKPWFPCDLNQAAHSHTQGFYRDLQFLCTFQYHYHPIAMSPSPTMRGKHLLLVLENLCLQIYSWSSSGILSFPNGPITFLDWQIWQNINNAAPSFIVNLNLSSRETSFSWPFSVMAL